MTRKLQANFRDASVGSGSDEHEHFRFLSVGVPDKVGCSEDSAVLVESADHHLLLVFYDSDANTVRYKIVSCIACPFAIKAVVIRAFRAGLDISKSHNMILLHILAHKKHLLSRELSVDRYLLDQVLYNFFHSSTQGLVANLFLEIEKYQDAF